MNRRHRVDFDGAVHHVMNRGVDRQTVFFADADRVEFGRRLAAIHRDFGIETLAYCLMDNHYHLVLRTPSAGLSAAMQQLGSLYTRHTNDRLGRDGPLFRGRFHAIPVTSDRYLLWAIRYIHRNPLALPGVGSPRAYRWSSYRAYLGHRRRPAFLRAEPLMSLLDGDVERLAALTESPDVPYAGDRPTADDLAEVVGFAIAEDQLLHGETDEGCRVLERTLLVAASDQIGDPHLTTSVHERIGTPTPAARRMARHRARVRRSTDPALGRTLDRVLDTLDPTRRAA